MRKLVLICQRCCRSSDANPLNPTLKKGQRLKLRCPTCLANTPHRIHEVEAAE